MVADLSIVDNEHEESVLSDEPSVTDGRESRKASRKTALPVRCLNRKCGSGIDTSISLVVFKHKDTCTFVILQVFQVLESVLSHLLTAAMAL